MLKPNIKDYAWLQHTPAWTEVATDDDDHRPSTAPPLTHAELRANPLFRQMLQRIAADTPGAMLVNAVRFWLVEQLPNTVWRQLVRDDVFRRQAQAALANWPEHGLQSDMAMLAAMMPIDQNPDGLSPLSKKRRDRQFAILLHAIHANRVDLVRQLRIWGAPSAGNVAHMPCWLDHAAQMCADLHHFGSNWCIRSLAYLVGHMDLIDYACGQENYDKSIDVSRQLLDRCVICAAYSGSVEGFQHAEQYFLRVADCCIAVKHAAMTAASMGHLKLLMYIAESATYAGRMDWPMLLSRAIEQKQSECITYLLTQAFKRSSFVINDDDWLYLCTVAMRKCIRSCVKSDQITEYGSEIMKLLTPEQRMHEDRASYIASWNVCNFALERNNSMKSLHWLVSHGFAPCRDSACAAAALHGNIERIQWLRELGCKWDADVCANAAARYHWKLVRWLHENGCPWDERVINRAIETDHLEMLEYALDQQCPWNPHTVLPNRNLANYSPKCVCRMLQHVPSTCHWVKTNATVFLTLMTTNNLNALAACLQYNDPTTSGHELVASMRVENVKFLASHPARKSWRQDFEFATWAAHTRGDLKLLAFMHDYDHSLLHVLNTTNYTNSKITMECVNYAMRYGAMVSFSSLANMAIHHRADLFMPIIQWHTDRIQCDWSDHHIIKDILHTVVEHAHVDCLKHMFKYVLANCTHLQWYQNIRCFEPLLVPAAKGGALANVQFLVEQGIQCTADAIKSAMTNDHLDCLEYLLSQARIPTLSIKLCTMIDECSIECQRMVNNYLKHLEDTPVPKRRRRKPSSHVYMFLKSTSS